MNKNMKQVETKIDRNVALCYVRQSQTRDEDDVNSPDRQKANITALCEQRGWIVELYEDAEGHKSGTKESNRPAWLALKSRLADPDVVALVANDLSRFHRKGWQIGKLIELVADYNMKLVTAASGKEIDASSWQGRAFAMLDGIFAEYYATDIAIRARDSIAHRKRKGLTVGIPPFGTVRDDNGYLIPTEDGAWLLTNGTFLAGNKEQPPNDAAEWRSYFEAAKRILELYAENKIGCHRIAYQMQTEGWAYRNRKKEPAFFEAEDIRRIINNWAEYGGFVFEKSVRARDRHPHDADYAQIVLNSERSVFPIELLKQVGAIRMERAIGHKAPNHGIKKADHVYALNSIVCCAHCEQKMIQHNDPSLRSRLAGMWYNTVPRYRHKSGVKCGSANHSVKAEILELEFLRLLELLTVREEQIGLLNRLAIQMAVSQESQIQAKDLETQKRAAIAKLQRQLNANKSLFEDGDRSHEEYRKIKSEFERDIQEWEARTTEPQRIPAELAVCIQFVNQLKELWADSNDEDRQGMVRNLFDYIVFDLDTHRITDFRLKAWANRFITVRGSLYEEEIKTPQENIQEEYTDVVPTGRRTYPRYFKLEFAFNRAKHKAQPRHIDPTKLKLQAQVIELRSSGWSFPAIAKYLDISVGTAWNKAKYKVY